MTDPIACERRGGEGAIDCDRPGAVMMDCPDCDGYGKLDEKRQLRRATKADAAKVRAEKDAQTVRDAPCRLRAKGGAMTDRCKKCGRPFAKSGTTCVSTVCGFTGSFGCEIASAAYLRGLREGVELAKVYTHAEAGVDALGRAVGWISWDGVDAELVRRTGG